MILDDLAESTRKRVEASKKVISPEKMKADALAMPKGDFAFEKALKTDDIAFICEVKKASPSKGIISADFPYINIVKEYQNSGAAAISVLTEPEYFLGSNKYLTEISKAVTIPIIRKDFTVDEYMIYEAKVIGASAVLLICSLLDTETVKKYIKICDSLGISALVEAHDEEEVRSAVRAGARIIGVNNRNLKTFDVDINNCTNLRKLVPNETVFVAESGIKTADDIDKLRKSGVNAVLIGETLMKAADKKAELAKLRGTP